MEHRTNAHGRSYVSRVARRKHPHYARRRHALVALTLVVALFSAGCETSVASSSEGASSGATARSAAVSRLSATQMAIWLARLFGINSPRWQSGVLAGETCGDHPTHAFCAYIFATTPDGKTLALASLSGEVRVWDVATERLLLDEPALADRSSTGSIGVWLSPDGRLVARAVYNAGINNPMVINSFQVWDIATRQPLIDHGPTVSSPWPQIGDVGLAPNGLVLVFVAAGWELLARSQSGYAKVATYQNTDYVQSVGYVASRAEWIVNLTDGYAVWKASAMPVMVKVPCYRESQVSTINAQGDLYACAIGGPDSQAHTGNSALIWDVTRKAEVARLEDGRHIGNVAALTFLNNGRSVALLAWPGPGNPVVTGPENLLLYSLAPRPAEQSVITLPGLSGGWNIYAIGRFAVAIGQGNGVGYYCCLKAVRQPAS
jgi:WD40 repeat protein